MKNLLDAKRRLEELDITVSLKLCDDPGITKEGILQEGVGRTLSLTPDGRIQDINMQSLRRYAFILKVPKAPYLEVFINEPRDERKIDLMQNSAESATTRTFVKKITAEKVEGSALYVAKYPRNYIKAISIKDGLLEIFELGIRSQKNGDWIVPARLYSARLYFDNKLRRISVLKSEYDGFEVWQDLQTLTAKMVKLSNMRDLPALPAETGIPSRPQLKKKQARIAWFNILRGYGKAITHDGREANAHWSQVISDRRSLISLFADQVVSYKDIEFLPDGELQLVGISQ